MISDALSEAVDELDRYLYSADWRDFYDDPLRAELVALRNAMAAMRRRLDTPPAKLTRYELWPGMRFVDGEWRYSAAWL